jgi:hypothetical protein
MSAASPLLDRDSWDALSRLTSDRVEGGARP